MNNFYLLKIKNYDFGILERKYNDFPTPPKSCSGYIPPKYKTHNQNTTIIRHRAGQFSGARTLDGNVVRCAYEQIDFENEAYEMNSDNAKYKKLYYYKFEDDHTENSDRPAEFLY